MRAAIRLFKCVLIDERKASKHDETIYQETMPHGFILSQNLIANYPDLGRLVQVVKEEMGLSGAQMNASFHKSWGKVRDASMEQLVIEQMIHYLTTYGYEHLGIYDEDTVYFPCEALDVPGIDPTEFKFIVISGVGVDFLKERLLKLLNSGAALHEQTMADALEVAMQVGLSGEEAQEIRNKEMRVMLYDYLGVVPYGPQEFLRYIIFKATNKSLLIKNEATVEAIKGRNNTDIAGLFDRYSQGPGLEALATIFYRFKPLFLAFKTNAHLNHTINRIRKLAVKHHKPMKQDYLNIVTQEISKGSFDAEKMVKALRKANLFRKARLAYALKFRTNEDIESIMFRIRNGKSWAKEYSFGNQEMANVAFAGVKESIAEDLEKKVAGKRIHIPLDVTYALPTTEKQFTGYFPAGTRVRVPRHMVFGVHWKNLPRKRVDLDLSLVNAGGKIGWDSAYRNAGRTILFSGDVTDAPGDGASELFYVAIQEAGSHLMVVNYFNHGEDGTDEVPFTIFVGQELVGNLMCDYMVDPNNVRVASRTSMNRKQKMLGLIETAPEGNTFTFVDTYMQNSISSSSNEHSKRSRRFLRDYYKNAISLNQMFALAGAELVTDEEDCDINLAPEALDKGTFIDLLV